MSSTRARTAGEHRLPAGHPLRRIQLLALLVGAVGLVGSVYGFQLDRVAFFRSYLVVFLYLLGFALGPIGILGLQYITGGRWGVALRRPLEAASSTLWLLAVLFVPIALGMHELYKWTDSELVAHDPILSAKAGYLDPQFFLWRAAGYFLIWITTAFFLRRLSRRQDVEPGEALDRRLQFLGRGTLVLYALTMTFASVDWAMSVDPHWFSHIYGVRMIGGQILTAFAFAIVVTFLLARSDEIAALIVPDRFHDLGNLLLAFIMLWAYFEFSQFLIIWSANLPEEVGFYTSRSTAGWAVYSLTLIALHFVAPFVILLSRPVKRRPATLAAVALLVLAMRAADVYWQITPSFEHSSILPHWVFAALLAGLGGVWLALFVQALAAYPLLPVNDTTLRAEE